MWLLGMLTMGGTFVFTALALYFGQLATVQPILVTELIFTLALRVLWLRDRIAHRTWGAAALLCAGLGGFLVVADPAGGPRPPHLRQMGRRPRQPRPRHRGAPGAQPMGIARPPGRPPRRAAALVWAIDAAFVKAATEVLAHDGWSGLFVHWPVYGVVVTGVLGTVLLESAFTAGPLAASQSALLIVDPLASIAIGIELFGEQLRNSPVAIFLAGRAARRHVRRRGPAFEVGPSRDGGAEQAVAPDRRRRRGRRTTVSRGDPNGSGTRVDRVLHRSRRSTRRSGWVADIVVNATLADRCGRSDTPRIGVIRTLTRSSQRFPLRTDINAALRSPDG